MGWVEQPGFRTAAHKSARLLFYRKLVHFVTRPWGKVGKVPSVSIVRTPRPLTCRMPLCLMPSAPQCWPRLSLRAAVTAPAGHSALRGSADQLTGEVAGARQAQHLRQPAQARHIRLPLPGAAYGWVVGWASGRCCTFPKPSL